MIREAVWRWLGWAAVLLLVTALAGIGLISAGVFDPRPVGVEQFSQPLTPLAIPAGESVLTWLPQPLPAGDASVRLTAAYRSGESDIGYGLALGNEETYWVAAVSPLGYLTVFSSHASTPSPLLPWQTWPHVRPGQAANEIWVNVIGGRATVRVNREWLWEGEMGAGGGRVGLWAESFGGAAVVDFQQWQLFAGNN